MGYLQEFQVKITSNDFTGLLQLWEEYCAGDEADEVEMRDILQEIKNASLTQPFGNYVETILPLWEMVEDETLSYEIIRLILDLQQTNSEKLATLAYDILKKKYDDHKYFNEKIRLVGLRNKEDFSKAITNYELLTHLDEGKYVYHTGGWGTGEIVDISLVREELALEFELVMGRRDLSFANAFKNLIALRDNHFLARRFGNPDTLEQEAYENPTKIIRLLLQDLGPKTAAEIKEALYELVIPADNWTKWWQSARAKIKKDTMIATPSNIRDSFSLRSEEISHEDQFQETLRDKKNTNEIIQTIYQFIRDFPEKLKNAELKKSLQEKLTNIQTEEGTSLSQKLQIYIFLENIFETSKNDNAVLPEFIRQLGDIEKVIEEIEIIAFKKRALVAIREYREDWMDIFLVLLFSIQQSVLRDYLLKELNQDISKDQLKEKLSDLIESPTLYPEAFVWYFQRVLNDGASLPFSNGAGKCRLFESFLILYHFLEQDSLYRDLVKKMYAILSGGRYVCVRSILQNTSIEYAKEILLLVTKCQTLSKHDIKILHSLAEVVHPSLAQKKKKESSIQNNNVIWTTEVGYSKVKERIHQIGTVETVENAKEIEAARALGDLRENSEYKFSIEKRNRLQAELKLLSDQLNKARLITKEDINTNEIGIGVIVHLKNSKGAPIGYTILGPWEADPDKQILSFQSKFAQVMAGRHVGETFSFQEEEYTVTSIESFIA